MNAPRSFRRLGTRPTLLFGLIALLLGLLALPQAALAHPLDEFLQATYITVAPTQIVVELNLTPGVLVAPQVLPQLDTDGDQQVSDAEGRAYVDAVLRDVVLEVDGKPLALAVTRLEVPAYLNIQAGYGTFRVFTTATLEPSIMGTHHLSYRNTFAPADATYQVNTFVDLGVAITLGKQNRDPIQQSMTVDYTIGAAPPLTPTVTGTTAATTGTATLDAPIEPLAGASEQRGQLLAHLYEPVLSPWVLLLGLGLAGVLGGLHALTPGHGKTLVAAYLIGSRGTVRHAVALGAIVTITHTASVIVIGLLALFASHFIVPGVLVPILEIFSGLLVVLLGVRLVWQRWSAFHRHRGGDAHNNGAAHTGGNSLAFTHDHGDGRPHTHLPPAEGLKVGSLVVMGVSGGLVPCPEALGIMVIAIGLNRILLGLGLIVSFSFGLAAVLIAIGLLLVRARGLVDRLGGLGQRGQQLLPLGSAIIVTVLGVGICVKGLLTYLY